MPVRRKKVAPADEVTPTKQVQADKSKVKSVTTKKPAVKKYGIQETQDVITLIASFLYALGAAKADNKWHWTDSFKFMQTLKSVPSAVVGLDKVPAEIADIDAEELKQIEERIISLLNMTDTNKKQRAKRLVEMAFDIIEMIHKLF